MDLGTVLGVVGGFGVLYGAVLLEGSSIGMFMNLLATVVVFGGATTVVLGRYTLKTFPQAFFGGIKDAILYKSHNAIDLLDELTEIAEVARKQGPLGLEKVEIHEPFLKRAVQMIADGYSAETIQHVLERERDLQYERLHMAHTCWAKYAEAGPGMGMIGTIIGLVSLFAHMSDPKQIGPAMSIALLTTLYGAVVGNVIAGPIGDKLGNRAAHDAEIQSMIIDAVILIRENKSPKQVREELLAYLPLKHRKSAEAEKEAA
ncbi:motility protein A [Oharaeibacter diazotrophicus]|uniref:Chemotaxis protein MotA n=1 Tax=Oharaeibacter diazotrophicus TaxID=1920512 RepID=A0A4R6RIN9_9HYPH|nr:MotA/TolQ/ExbB proton channel family protein [Oharaeibacter diazotrophicus]TDP86441.1 chemotaxis protein MotA [Oharaeibacter diazotrophicus]BBE71617.1 chemotaxis protein PomA [Pleomorphomonas sp. SM30]GLS78379.1 flagellar motor protein PomA [Oharaeibacter diazotrophicus]